MTKHLGSVPEEASPSRNYIVVCRYFVILKCPKIIESKAPISALNFELSGENWHTICFSKLPKENYLEASNRTILGGPIDVWNAEILHLLLLSLTKITTVCLTKDGRYQYDPIAVTTIQLWCRDKVRRWRCFFLLSWKKYCSYHTISA